MRSFKLRFSGALLRRGECGPPVCPLCARSPQTRNSTGLRPQKGVLPSVEKDTRFLTPRACIRRCGNLRAEKCHMRPSCGSISAKISFASPRCTRSPAEFVNSIAIYDNWPPNSRKVARPGFTLAVLFSYPVEDRFDVLPRRKWLARWQ